MFHASALTITSSSAWVRGAAATLAAAALTAAAPAVAEAKTYRGTATDPTGDAANPGVDITEVKVRYKTNGSLLLTLTTAGPIDGAAANGVFAVALGQKKCKKTLLGGGGVFSEPAKASGFLQKTMTKVGKSREGKGEIVGNTYTVSVKHSSFGKKKPDCFAAVILDPATIESPEPTILDQTEEFKIK